MNSDYISSILRNAVLKNIVIENTDNRTLKNIDNGVSGNVVLARVLIISK